MRLTIEWLRVRILLRPFGNFGNFLYPTLPVSFGRYTKGRCSLLSGVDARGSKRSHQSALETCNLSWTPPPTLRDHTSSWTTLEISLKTFVCYPVNMMCSKSKSNQIEPAARVCTGPTWNMLTPYLNPRIYDGHARSK